jgi:lipopolysaccharide heptosyltransferase III
VVEPAAAPVLHRNPHINDLIVAPKRRGLARVREDLMLARRLRRDRFDIAIDLHGGPRSAWLTWASGAPRRIGYAIKGRSWMYTDVVPRAADLAPRHSVVNQWDLLRPLGIGPCDPERDAVEMADDPEAAARVSERLRVAGINDEAPLIVVHVSAGNPFRRWPEESFSELLVRLAEADPRRRILLTAGPSDAEAAGRVLAAARARLRTPESVPIIPDWDLAELRALIARAAVYIGGDSGPAHVAATTTTPIVELLGPTLAERSRPWRSPRLRAEIVDAGPLSCRPCDQRRCAPGDFRCLRSIAPARVIEAAERVLRR